MTADDRELLIRIDTKLTVVCGENGDGGVLAVHEKRIRDLEDARTLQRGAHRAVFVLWTAISGGIVWVVDHLGRWHGGK